MSEELRSLSADLDLRIKVNAHIERAVFEYLCEALEAAAGRFSDIAELMERPEGFSDTGFLRVSAERYRGVVDAAKRHRGQ